MMLQYFDFRRGFDNDKPNWFICKIINYNDDMFEFMDRCETMVDWLYSELDMPERHCRWTCDSNSFTVKFRYLHQLNWFNLRWK